MSIKKIQIKNHYWLRKLFNQRINYAEQGNTCRDYRRYFFSDGCLFESYSAALDKMYGYEGCFKE